MSKYKSKGKFLAGRIDSGNVTGCPVCVCVLGRGGEGVSSKSYVSQHLNMVTPGRSVHFICDNWLKLTADINIRCRTMTLLNAACQGYSHEM